MESMCYFTVKVSDLKNVSVPQFITVLPETYFSCDDRNTKPKQLVKKADQKSKVKVTCNSLNRIVAFISASVLLVIFSSDQSDVTQQLFSQVDQPAEQVELEKQDLANNKRDTEAKIQASSLQGVEATKHQSLLSSRELSLDGPYSYLVSSNRNYLHYNNHDSSCLISPVNKEVGDNYCSSLRLNSTISLYAVILLSIGRKLSTKAQGDKGHSAVPPKPGTAHSNI